MHVPILVFCMQGTLLMADDVSQLLLQIFIIPREILRWNDPGSAGAARPGGKCGAQVEERR